MNLPLVLHDNDYVESLKSLTNALTNAAALQ